jgi:hypothetical protein
MFCASCRNGDFKQPQDGGQAMTAFKTVFTIRGLGMVSLVAGLLGAAFCWWDPLGMVSSLTGLTLGFVGWMRAPSKTRSAHWAIVGMLVCVAALVLDLTIAGFGLEIIRLHALR